VQRPHPIRILQYPYSEGAPTATRPFVTAFPWRHPPPNTPGCARRSLSLFHCFQLRIITLITLSPVILFIILVSVFSLVCTSGLDHFLATGTPGMTQPAARRHQAVIGQSSTLRWMPRAFAFWLIIANSILQFLCQHGSIYIVDFLARWARCPRPPPAAVVNARKSAATGRGFQVPEGIQVRISTGCSSTDQSVLTQQCTSAKAPPTAWMPAYTSSGWRSPARGSG